MQEFSLKLAMSTRPVLTLSGPTASGKTALACQWFEQYPFRLISVDSALIYRGMNIGTAKPAADELLHYPHALIDICNPEEVYSVSAFLRDVAREIDAAHASGQIPLLVGGTMMYFKALWEGIADEMPAASAAIRHQILQIEINSPPGTLHQLLQSVDAVTAARFLPSDRQRIFRALEVYYASGKPLSWWHQNQQLYQSPYQFHNFVVMPERTVIHQNIAARLEKMWENGLLDEVTCLKKNPLLNRDLPSMRCVGYRQVWDYLELAAQGENADLEETKNKVLYATRQLAKRQFTWIRSLSKNNNMVEVNPDKDGRLGLQING